MFSALSFDDGTLRNKLSSFSALAPIVFMKNSTNKLLQSTAPHWKLMKETTDLLNIHVLTNPTNPDSGMSLLCGTLPAFCNGIS